jgi:predicted N-acetyltransferase YhbS
VADDAVEPKDILGFFSLNLCQVKADELPPEHEKKFPREVGAVRLGRLAVSKLRQRQGLGTVLLVAALNKAMDVFRTAGGVGLFVDAKDIPAKEYYERFGFISLPANELQLFLPIKTIAALLSER